MTVADLQTEALAAVCRACRVKALYAFGSVVSGEHREASDLDFLVEFEAGGAEGAFDRFMTLKESLEGLYGRRVDLLALKPFRNPVFQAEVDRSRRLIYAA